MAVTNKMFDLLDPFIQEIQDIEYALSDLELKRAVSTAEGTQLDRVGDTVGQPRLGAIDSVYRASILLKIILNTASGDPETVIAYLKRITNSSNVLCIETYPAGVLYDVDGDQTLVLGSDLKHVVEKVLPASVKLRIVYINPAYSPFTFGPEGAYTPVGEGFLEEGYSEIVGSYTAGALSEQII